MDRYVNVAVPLPMRKLFTYRIPAHLQPQPGARVLVPFGTQKLTGIIVETDVPPHPEAKLIEELLDEHTPAIIPAIMDLTRWMADYYLCSWGEALAAALPREIAPRAVVRVRLRRSPTDEELEQLQRRAPKRARLLEVLMHLNTAVTVGYLQRQLQTESITAQLESLEDTGFIELEATLEHAASPQMERVIIVDDALVTNPQQRDRVLEELEHRAPKQAQALAKLVEINCSSSKPLVLSHAAAVTGVSRTVLEALIAKGYVHVLSRERSRIPEEEGYSLAPERSELTIPLTEEQAHAVARIQEALSAERTKTFLLHGVTGSGKTVVYMHTIAAALEANKTALVLVPEISLTPQLIDRFKRAFGSGVVAFHSRMSSGERYDAWRAIRRGEIRLVLGPRSALFAPLQKLGIIIVDEEHDSSYKQDSPPPRYNARDAAIVRGHIENAVVVLGSATPALESMYNAATGRYHLLELSTRADGATLPHIHLVDCRKERQYGTMYGRFSHQLLQAILDRLKRKEGIILLHNRRGFAPRLECPECGYVPHCQQCNVALTYHKRTAELRCHYCGRSYPVPEHCPQCGNPVLEAVGAGTQRIEDELAALLKQYSVQAVIARVDTDVTSAKGSLRRILHDFAHGRIDILVGTQMIAKGIDIGRVTLVGVLNADMQLYIPDFRAAERTFQLLVQVAGRAGRRPDHPGEVLIQTSHPEHIAIKSARLYRYDLFYNDELQERRLANYPPFSRVVLIEFSGYNAEQVEQHAHTFAHYMPRGVDAITTLGPASPSVDRIKGRYRRILLVKGDRQLDPKGIELRRAILTAWSAYNQRYGSSSIRVNIDVDTQSSL